MTRFRSFLSLDKTYLWLVISTLVLPIANTGSASSTLSESGLIIEGLQATDDSGSSARLVTYGSAVHIVSTVMAGTGQAATGSLMYVVQVKDPDNRVTHISAGVMMSEGDQGRSIETVWIAGEQDGIYIVQVFAWQPTDSPVIFAHSYLAIAVYESETAACSGSAACFSGIVTRIVDGDTLAVNGITLRLALVNSPERGEGGFDKATAFTASLCPEGSVAFVDEDDGQRSGSYGRMIALVYCEGGNINEKLLTSENALILTQYCDESEFAMQEWALRNGC